MKKLSVIFLSIFLTGCASINYRVVGWYNVEAPDPSNTVMLENGRVVKIVGNPRITCYSKDLGKIADGIFVRVQNGFLEVDEFGKGYDYIPNGTGNYYCRLGEQN